MERNQHHGHVHGAHQLSGKNIGVAVLLNIFITISQIIGGLVSGSMSLLSDALHNFSDVISLLVSFLANRLAKKKATSQRTYGFKRAEILSALINSATLIAIAIFLVCEVVKRILNPVIVLSDLVIYLALASIIINFISVLILHRDAKESMNIKSAYLHLLTDVMTSLAVVIGGILMKFLQVFWVDSILSVAIAFYLILSSYKLFWASIKILMQFAPQNIDITDIRDQIVRVGNVKNVHHVHLWQLNDKDLFFEAHIDLQNNIYITDFQEIMLRIETILNRFKITHFNIQPEYSKNDSKELVMQH